MDGPLSYINIGKFQKAMIYYFTHVHISTCIVLEQGNLSTTYEFIKFGLETKLKNKMRTFFKISLARVRQPGSGTRGQKVGPVQSCVV